MLSIKYVWLFLVHELFGLSSSFLVSRDKYLDSLFLLFDFYLFLPFIDWLFLLKIFFFLIDFHSLFELNLFLLEFKFFGTVFLILKAFVMEYIPVILDLGFIASWPSSFSYFFFFNLNWYFYLLTLSTPFFLGYIL
jgi:hypothetical protein